MQLLTQLYMTLLRALRHQYLEDLLEMQALCTLLCGIHSPAQTQVCDQNKLDSGALDRSQSNAHYIQAPASMTCKRIASDTCGTSRLCHRPVRGSSS